MELDVKETFETRIHEVWAAIRALFGGADEADTPELDIDLVYTFDDAAIIRDYVSGRYFILPYSRLDGEILFGDPKETNMMFVSKRLLEANPNLTVKGIQEIAAACEEWAGDFEKGVKALTGRPGVDNPAALCAWLHYQTEGVLPAETAHRARKTAGKAPVELTGPIVYKNTSKRIAYAAVLVPGEEDYDGEAVTKEKIEDAAHEWMELYQNVDLQHTLTNVGVPVESYLAPVDMTVKALDGEEMVLPEGTWILGSKLDEATWDAVQKGVLTGYSVMGVKRAALKAFQDSAAKSADGATISVALKKTLLRDLGQDWVPVFVSVVDRPAVPKAKFFALKSRAEGSEGSEPGAGAGENPQKAAGNDNKPWFLRWIESFSGKKLSDSPSIPSKKDKKDKEGEANQQGLKFSDAAYANLKIAHEALGDLLTEARGGGGNNPQKGGEDMTEEQVKELVSGAVKEAVEEAVTPLRQELEAMKASLDAPADNAPDDKGAGTAAGSETEPAPAAAEWDFEAFKARVEGRLDEIFKKLGMGSSALKGQDSGEDSPKKEENADYRNIPRDVYGRRMRSAEVK